MNYKSLLLASAAVLLSGSAFAADLTNPFFQPGEGNFLSTTSLETSRTKAKHHQGALDGNYLQEDIEYGINDNWSVNGSITNSFDTEGEYNNSHNFTYSLGTTYNTTVDNLIFHAAAAYETSNPKDFLGHHTPLRWEKVLGGELGIGYDMGDGLTPYAIYNLQGNIDTANRYLDQSLTAGVHKYSGDYAFDVAARYNYSTDGKNTNEWWGLAGADYYPQENIALGIYGEYFLGGTGSNMIDYDYTAGLRAKVLF